MKDFAAIDFETATGKRASICEVGICVVRNGEIIETKSWLVQPVISLITRKAKSAVLNASVVKLLHIYISLKCFHL